MKKNSILIIESNYYKKISFNLRLGAEEVLKKFNYKYEIILVPGALEIPVTLEKYKNLFRGFIVLGCVIRGETSHYDIVTNITSSTIFDSVQKNKIPLGFGLITAENMSQAIERSDIKKRNLGRNAAEVCIKMVNILEGVKNE